MKEKGMLPRFAGWSGEENAPRGGGKVHYVFMCARRGPAGDEGRRTKTGGSVTMMCGWEGPEGLREWRKRSGPIVGLFPPETKQVDARARQASGTGTVEWRSASVGMLS